MALLVWLANVSQPQNWKETLKYKAGDLGGGRDRGEEGREDVAEVGPQATRVVLLELQSLRSCLLILQNKEAEAILPAPQALTSPGRRVASFPQPLPQDHFWGWT